MQRINQTSQQALDFSLWQKTNEIQLRSYIPSLFARECHDYYCLKVSGDSLVDDSMISQGRLARDLVLVKRTEQANDEDIIVSVVDGQVKLKKFKKYGDHIELHSANSKDEPIIVTPQNDFRIAGVVEGTFQLSIRT